MLSLMTASFPSIQPFLFSVYRTSTLRLSAVKAPQQQCPPATTMYELLAMMETAGPKEIKAAFRRQAWRWHPDASRSTGKEPFFAEQFVRVRDAYEVLSDPVLCHDYDRALWAIGGGHGVRARRREGFGFGDWEAQLEELRRRADRPGREVTWASRMRSGAAHCSAAV